MHNRNRFIKTVLIVLLIALVVIQFIRPTNNAGEEIPAHQITAVQAVPADVMQILKVSCYDCHSNTTSYPWYSRLQPIAWFLEDHILEGRKELNFSIFATFPANRRYKKFKEIGKEVKDGDMPLYSYTLLHPDASLNADQQLIIENWAANAMKDMEAAYPADSLVRPKAK